MSISRLPGTSTVLLYMRFYMLPELHAGCVESLHLPTLKMIRFMVR